jgi:hypothetical protein
MVAIAGCSTGGDSGNETSPDSTSTTELEEEGGTPTDGDTDDGTDGSAVNISQELSNAEPFSGSTQFEMTIINGSEELSITVKNDTERQLYRLEDSQSGGVVEYYITDGPDAYRNTSSGETRYATGESRLENSAGFAIGFLAIAGFGYIGVMDWEPAGTTTVDGQSANVFEADSINQSALSDDDSGFSFTPSNAESGTGRLVIDDQGRLRSASVRINTPQGTVGTDLTITTGDDITVSQPDWIDESQFGS